MNFQMASVAFALCCAVIGCHEPQEPHWVPATQTESKELHYSPPIFKEFVIQPMADSEIPELEGLQQELQRRFAPIPVRIAPRTPLPKGAFDANRGQVIYEDLIPSVSTTAGTVAVIDQDFATRNMNFLYANLDTEKSRAVVSVARFRAPNGKPTGGPAPTGPDLERSRQRALGQLTSSIAKVLGMSFPCHEQKCVLQFPRNMEQFDAKGTEFCDKHKAELAAITKNYPGH